MDVLLILLAGSGFLKSVKWQLAHERNRKVNVLHTETPKANIKCHGVCREPGFCEGFCCNYKKSLNLTE